jgi:hypothetical protein
MEGDDAMRETRGNLAMLLLGLLALAGCTSVKALEGPPQDLRTLYQTSLSTPRPVLTTSPRAPDTGDDPHAALLKPPRVQKVWVPTQRTPEGDLVTGHWTYLLLDAPQWRLEPAAPPGLPLAPLPLPPPAQTLPASAQPPFTPARPGSAPSVPLPGVTLPGYPESPGLPTPPRLPAILPREVP